MKKLISLLLAAVMVFALAACGGGSGDNGGGSQPANQDGQTSNQGGDQQQPAGPAEIDMDEEPYTVAIQIVGLPGSDFSAIEAEMEEKANAITLPAINAKLDVQFVWISEVVNTTSMAVAGNEKIDLVHVATVNPLSSLVGSDLLLDMNENNLLQTHGSHLVELFGDLLKTGYVNGKQLAVPANVFNATAQGVYYNKSMTDAAGITIPEKGTLDDFEKAMYALHDANPDVWPWYSGSGSLNYLYWLNGYEGFGQECSYGAILDQKSTDPKVENIYASDLFRDWALRCYRWTRDGVMHGDTTNSEPAQNYIAAQQLFCTCATYNQYQKAQYGANAANSGYEIGWIVFTDFTISNAAITEYMWGIASNSERPDKAMDMLNLIYENAELANLLKYGIEGKNYEFAPGSSTVIIPNGSYLPMFYNAGDANIMLVQAPGGDDYIELNQRDEAAATPSLLVDYMFDDSEFQAESAAIYSTIVQYLPTIQAGQLESEEATLAYVDEFVAKLEASGINDVIAANQAQIDAHLGK